MATRRAITRLTFSASRSSSAPAIADAGGITGFGTNGTAGLGSTGAKRAGGVPGRDAAVTCGPSPEAASSTIAPLGEECASSSGTTLAVAIGAWFTPVASRNPAPSESGWLVDSARVPMRGAGSSETTLVRVVNTLFAPLSGGEVTREENRSIVASNPVSARGTSSARTLGTGATGAPRGLDLSFMPAMSTTAGAPRSALRPGKESVELHGAGEARAITGAASRSSLPGAEATRRGAAGVVAAVPICCVAAGGEAGPSVTILAA